MTQNSSGNAPERGLESFPWSPPSPDSPVPRWTGNGFKLGDQTHPILYYEVGASGWSDALTSLHEEAAGEDHFMDRASRSHVIHELKKYLPLPHSLILEVGCSSGFMLRQIREEMPQVLLMGADYVAGPLLRLAAQVPTIPLLQFDLTLCPLPESSLDAVVLLNVLEHITDDRAAMAQVVRILKPGGIAVIEVPA
ncbi:MAG: class I SAM-dependent methyltransferase, partial [Deltaproteobacteria bacterium]|nr:class I SAM-dependent methyltransferase [Deltaproteobacteria bacterium]